jgi:heat shock protein HslJ
MGPKWYLVGSNPSAPITLEYLDREVFAGSSGCNHYSTPVKHETDAAISIGPIASTTSSCTSETWQAQEQFFRRLEAASLIQRRENGIAIQYDFGEGKENGELVFTTAPPF